MQKNKKHYDNQITDVIHHLSYKNKIPLIMGSNSYLNKDLNGLDYDLYSKIIYKSKPMEILKVEIIDYLKTLVLNLYTAKNTYLME